MNHPENDKWLDEALSETIGSKKPGTDFEEWKQRYPEAVEMLTSRARLKDSTINRPHSIRIMITKSPITKLAAAAVIIIMLLVGLNQFGGSIDGASVAWGEVAEKVDEALTYICRVNFSASVPGEEKVELEGTVYASSEYGQKQDVYKDGKLLKYTYFIPEQKVEYDVMPVEKRYRRKQLTEKELKVRQVREDMRESIKELMSCKYKKLGRDTIDGKDVEGIEIHDPKPFAVSFSIESAVAQLWVDVETYLPVLLKGEVNGTKGEKIALKAEKFQWDVELDASIFEPNIPTDYMQIPMP